MTEQFRTIPYDATAECCSCGAVGAYDFMGDFYCPVCAEEMLEEKREEMEDAEYDTDND